MALIDFHKARKAIHEHNPGGKMLWRETVLKLLGALPEVDPVHAAGGCYCRECDEWNEGKAIGYKEYGNRAAPCAIWSNSEDGHISYTTENEFCGRGRRREGGE